MSGITCDQIRTMGLDPGASPADWASRHEIASHIEHCADCQDWMRDFAVAARAWTSCPADAFTDQVLARTSGLEAVLRDLPLLAELDPGPGFAERVFLATSNTPEPRGWRARAAAAWWALVRRPRFAWEAAYVVTVCWVLVFGNPVSAIEWSAANLGTVARDRLQAFFARGGGYIGTSQNANNFTFLTGAGLVTSPLVQGQDTGADGGIALWNNTGGPITGPYPSRDYLFLDNNITYFSATPADAVIDGRYLPSTTDMFIAGLWLNRNPVVANAPMAVHGNTTVNSRYAGLSANPFSRMDAEREWLWVGQAALWSNLTDEA